MNPRAHWQQIYETRHPTEVSWYQAEPTRSIDLLRELGANRTTAIIDIGGGESTLVDAVVTGGLGRMTVLDVSGAALARAQSRLGARAEEVTWIEADVTRVELPRATFDVWHDRAMFHFLTARDDRARYAEAAASALRPGGMLIVATFALDGPARCSGLEVVRYSAEGVAEELGGEFELVRGFADVHRTPAGREQRFTVAVLRRG